MSLFRRKKRRSLLGDPVKREALGIKVALTPTSWDPLLGPMPPDGPTPAQHMGKGEIVQPTAAPAPGEGFLQPKYPFGERSREVWATLDSELKEFTHEVADHWNISLIEGYRSPERQLELYNQGPHVTKVKFGKHNTMPSKAVDMAPYPIDWNDIDQFIRFTYWCKGLADARGYNIRNGADWDEDNDYADHSFLDWVHWEKV